MTKPTEQLSFDPTQRIQVRAQLNALTGQIPSSPREAKEWFQRFCFVSDTLSEVQTNLEIALACDTSNTETRNSIAVFENEILSQLLSSRSELMTIYLSNPWQTAMHADDRGRLREDFERRQATSHSELTSLQLEENRLIRAYREFSQSAQTQFLGSTVPLSAVVGKMTDRSEELRQEAYASYWSFVHSSKDTYRHHFLGLSKNRNQQAARAGVSSYEEFVYRDMGRMDFDRQDSRNLCQWIHKHIVPIIQRLVTRQHTQTQSSPPNSSPVRLKPWNDRIWQSSFPSAPPSRSDRERLVSNLREAMTSLHPAFVQCLDEMLSSKSLDLFPRPHKAPGAFCALRPVSGVPFVFGNFSVSLRDLFTIFHELGHAVHGYCSAPIANSLQRNPGIEFCEFVSTTFEFLAHDVLDHFWDSKTDAQQARRFHLFHSLAFLPFAAQIDEWQSRAYEDPESLDLESLWSDLNRTYRPYVDWGESTSVAARSQGLGWCSRPHVFSSPFYFIDYVIAQMGAWQIYGKIHSAKDTKKESPSRREALNAFVNTLALGGQRSSLALFEAAGCTNPFQEATVIKVARIIEDAFADL